MGEDDHQAWKKALQSEKNKIELSDLNLTFRGREMLSMTEGTLTIFVLRVREDQRERPLNRTMYYKSSDENLLPSARTVKMGHGPVLTMTKNTQKAKDEAH